MRKLLPVAAVIVLLAGSAVAQEQVVVRDGEKAYTVEVVSMDPTAKTLTIKTDTGPSTLVVSETALGGLKGIRPGDTITVNVRDEATGQRRMVTAVVKGTATTRTAEPVRDKTLVVKTSDSPVEFFTLDPDTRRITVIGANGEKQVFRVDENAMVSIGDIKAGQKVLLSYRFDRDGKPEAVVRVTRAGSTGVVRIDSGSTVQVVAADPTAKMLTIRATSGQKTLVVDDKAVASLRDLRPGETIVVGLEGDRVVVITRKE